MKKNTLLVGMLVLLLMFVSACSGTASKGAQAILLPKRQK